jgi:hypothetical protein
MCTSCAPILHSLPSILIMRVPAFALLLASLAVFYRISFGSPLVI